MEAAPLSDTQFDIPAPPPVPRVPRTLRRIPGLDGLLLRGRAEQREHRYRDQLSILRSNLAALHTAEQAALDQQQPDPTACLRLATTAPEWLWQRSLEGAIRVGVSRQPSKLTVSAPRQPEDGPADPLIAAALELAAVAAWLPEAPVTVSVEGSCAVRGPREQILAVTRALLVQLTCHWSPESLRLAIVLPEIEQAAWRWARWLPHVQLPDGRRRLAWDAATAAGALVDANFVVLADQAHPVRMPDGAGCIALLREGEAALAGSTVIEVNEALRGCVLPDTTVDRLDTATPELAERVARALAAQRPATPSGSEGIVEVHLDGTRSTLQEHPA